jgi:hypothetical protein
LEDIVLVLVLVMVMILMLLVVVIFRFRLFNVAKRVPDTHWIGQPQTNSRRCGENKNSQRIDLFFLLRVTLAPKK